MEDSFINIGIAYLLGIAMPGPTIALIIKNSLTHSRKTAIIACLGTMLGIGLQSGLVLLGLTLFSQDSIFLKTLKIASSLYLIYLGLNILFSNKNRSTFSFLLGVLPNFKDFFYYILGSKKLSYIKINSNLAKMPFIEGLLLEILNPLAFSFFVSVLSAMIIYTESYMIKFLYWIEIMIIGLLWFCSVAIFSSSNLITNRLRQANKFIEPITGIIFVFFGIKCLLM